jgi:hypothetical protein
MMRRDVFMRGQAGERYDLRRDRRPASRTCAARADLHRPCRARRHLHVRRRLRGGGPFRSAQSLRAGAHLRRRIDRLWDSAAPAAPAPAAPAVHGRQRRRTGGAGGGTGGPAAQRPGGAVAALVAAAPVARHGRRHGTGGLAASAAIVAVSVASAVPSGAAAPPTSFDVPSSRATSRSAPAAPASNRPVPAMGPAARLRDELARAARAWALVSRSRLSAAPPLRFWDPWELKLAEQARDIARSGHLFDPTAGGHYPGGHALAMLLSAVASRSSRERAGGPAAHRAVRHRGAHGRLLGRARPAAAARGAGDAGAARCPLRVRVAAVDVGRAADSDARAVAGRARPLRLAAAGQRARWIW